MKNTKDRIAEIKKQLKYIQKRDKVCLSFGTEQEIAELEKELKQLESKFDSEK